MLVNCLIDPRDEIYEFFARHPLACNPVREYLSDGWRTLSELMIALGSVDRALQRMDSVLEFAAGFGRFSRHLARVLPGKVTCSDVQPGAVEFLREQFAVGGFYSGHDPQALDIPGQYELVFVLSMFTHLPPSRWGAWLRKLHGAVRPGGCLLFTVHNEAHGRGLGVVFEPDGTRFLPTSESRLSAEVYGTTFTTREFVQLTLAEALPGKPFHFRENAFWNGQDAVIVES
jgi:SAM-dependent methyltransferase